MTTQLQTAHPTERHSTAADPARKSIIGLDLLRITAAIIVTFHHLSFGTSGLWPHYGLSAAIGSFFWTGWIGVEIFFVISGFVIPYSARHANVKSFVVSRATRLYPAAWICATITALDVLLTHATPQFAPHLGSAWLRSVLLSPVGPWTDGVYWTLAVELSFYFLIAVVLALGRFKSVGKIMGALGVLSTTGWILYLLSTFNLLHQHALVWFGIKAVHSRTGQFLLLEHGCLFALGTLLWLGFSQRFTTARSITIAYCFIGCCCEIFHAAGSFGHPPLDAFGPMLFWIACMIVLAVTTRHNARMHDLFGVRGAVIVRRLGLMTYPLYLLHQQNGYIYIRLLHGIIPDLAALFIIVTGLVCLSFVVSRFAEEPLQRRLKRLLLPRQPNPPQPAATLP